MTLKEVFQALVDGKKVRDVNWPDYDFIHFKDDKIVNYRDIPFPTKSFSIVDKNWEIYKEPKQKKRFYLWSVKDEKGQWSKTFHYYNEQGFTTDGQHRYGPLQANRWNSEKQIKHENEFIDVEVES